MPSGHSDAKMRRMWRSPIVRVLLARNAIVRATVAAMPCASGSGMRPMAAANPR